MYIEKNTELDMNAMNDFELLNNSVFGKTMKNLRNRVEVRLVNDKKIRSKLIAKPNCHSVRIITPSLVSTQTKKQKICLNKPIFSGMAILDLSKTLINYFHYNWINEQDFESSQTQILFVITLWVTLKKP